MQSLNRVKRFFARYAIWLVVLAVVAVIGYGVYLIQQYRPPKELTLATGRPGGAYYAFGQQYQQRLAEQGYTLHIRPTAGAVETLDLLKKGEVDAGFVQTYVSRDQDVSELHSLASLFYEPLWIFHRADLAGQPGDSLLDLNNLQNRRIGIGEVGSGTYALAQFVLAENGITSDNATLVALPNAEAAQKLLNGELDAALMILAVESDVVQQLVRARNVEIMGVSRAPAYQLRYDDIAVVTLPQGAIDLAQDIPHEDKTLLAAVAMLIAHNDLSLDWERLLLQTAIAVHGEGGLLEKSGEFPSDQYVDIPISTDAEAFLTNGSTGLDRFLPLWIASRLEWVLFVIVPVLILIYPLLRGGPIAYSSFTRYRIYRWYKRLRRIDSGINRYSLAELDQHIAGLARVRAELISRMSVPTMYLGDLYNLLYQMDLVAERLAERRRILELGEQMNSVATVAEPPATEATR